jgi:uncharacterized protein
MTEIPDGLVDRESEKHALRQLAEQPGPALGLLFGRRRLGKTFLLDRTWPDARVFYYLAADTTPGMNRLDLLRDLAEWSGRELEATDYPSWRTVFRLFVELARGEPLIAVLDEFQYLLGGEDDVASQLVAVWDREVRDASLTLVLCGSEVSTMSRLREADQPLYGRFDWSHRLRAFDYFDASRMVSERQAREAAVVYGVFGGTPQYLDSIRTGETLTDAACRTMLEPGGPVRVQLENIIEQEKGIRKPAEYRAVLAAVARGRTEKNEIATAAALEGKEDVIRHIQDRLRDLGLVWSERNFGAPPNAPLRYRISDNAVRFWYRFVDPNRSHIELGEALEVWTTKVEPQLDTYMGKIFEGISREGFVRKHEMWNLPGATQWGRWEGQDRNRHPIEIDVVAKLADGSMLTGEVKWSSQPVGPSLHTNLRRDLEALAGSGIAWANAAVPAASGARFMHVSAAGFTDEFRALASGDDRISLIDLSDLYAGR